MDSEDEEKMIENRRKKRLELLEKLKTDKEITGTDIEARFHLKIFLILQILP